MWLLGFKYRKKITIDHTKIEEDLVDFPVGVFLNNSNFDFTRVRDDGYDFRFTDTQGNLLAHELVTIDKTAQKAELWVKVPSVSSSVDTEFYMFYGFPDLDVKYWIDPKSVWSNNYYAVWHMKLTGHSIPESVRGNHGNISRGRSIITYNDWYSAVRNAYAGDYSYVSLPVNWNEVFINNSFNLEWIGGIWNLPSQNYKLIVATDFREDGTWNDPYGVIFLNSYYNNFYIDEKFTIPVYQTPYLGTILADSSLRYININTIITGNQLTLEYMTDITGSAIDSSGGITYTSWRGFGNSTQFSMGTRSPYTEAGYLGFICEEFRISPVARSHAWRVASVYACRNQLVIYGSQEETQARYISGVVCDPTGTPITGRNIPILVLDPTNKVLLKAESSSSFDGSWATEVYGESGQKLLLVYYHQGTYGNYQDIAGAELA